MRRAPILLAALVMVAGCQSTGQETKETKERCSGTDSPDAVHIIRGGTTPLPGGARAGINTIGDDHEATLTLMGGAPGDPGPLTVKVGDQFTVTGHRFEVIKVCGSLVSVLEGS
ncbi:hypothetical protein [Planotetraspora mira]|uniref:hypothetical protein n=1 Tax=Planotetraspora mira TaxID=58121 RepID=UPI001EF384EF|nr:hypothetical protein [Planotetraspora mira]